MATQVLGYSWVRKKKVEISRIYGDGFLYLREDPAPWILRNFAHRLSVRSLELDLKDMADLEEIGDSIAELAELTHLLIRESESLKCVRNVIRLHNLQVLKLHDCSNLEELPANLGDFKSLTHLTLVRCRIKFLPDSIVNLSKLSTLHVSHCEYFQELPANLGDFKSLTHLTLVCCRIKFLPDSIVNLSKLSTLRVLNCEYFQELPANLGDFKSLTHLTLEYCRSIKFLPDSIVNLSKLSTLHVSNCEYFQELPANLGDFKSLTHLTLKYCRSIKFLPDSIVNLSNLSNLEVVRCESLTALPAKLNVVYLKLYNCGRMQSLPEGLTNLESLDLQVCNLSVEWFSNLIMMHAKRLRHLTIFICYHHPIKEFPINLDELPQLSLLDIHYCKNIKYLPWNITNLHKLRLLLLHKDFRLETLPFHLNDSVIICVDDRNIRKTWKEVKQDMGPLLIPVCRVSPTTVEMETQADQNHSPIYASGYLSLKGDPSSWNQNYYNLCLLVRILDLELPNTVEEMGDVIGAMPNLTHLYISGDEYLQCLSSETTTRLTHLSLHDCDLRYLSDSMGKLSNLKSLDLCLWETELPAALDLLSCLECLSLRGGEDVSLPDSMAKLSKLKTLELNHCDIVSLPENLNLTKLKIVCCSIESLPTSLCHLEIIHDMDYCYDLLCLGELDNYGKPLVNLKSLSLTCCWIKFLPSIAGFRHLQTLLLKDCFNLRKLFRNLDELAELCTLDISGTRIESLPECITKLPKLQHLILPKCFKQNILSSDFLKKEPMVKIEHDDMDAIYYEIKDYYHCLFENSTETSVEDEDDETSNEKEESGEEGIIAVQTSPSQMQNPPEVTQVLGDFHISRRNFTIGQSSHHASLPSQIQEMGNNSSRVHSGETLEDMFAELISNFQQTIGFDENRQMSAMNLGAEESNRLNQITPFNGARPSALDGDNDHVVVDRQNYKNPHGSDKKGNSQKIEITREDIQSLRDQNMTLVDAGKKLGVSRSTMKRRCKELGLGEWPSSRNKKINNTKKRKTNTKLPSDPDHAVECLDDVNQHNLQEQVAPDCDAIDNLTPNVTTASVQEPTLADNNSVDINEPGPECSNDVDLLVLSSNVQERKSSSSFLVKATYKEFKVKFKCSFATSVDELKQAVVNNLQIVSDRFVINYKDEDKDWILINTKEHLEDALSLMENNVLMLKVIDL